MLLCLRYSTRALAVLLASIALTACTDDAGTPCRYDYQCYSSSCTLGSCDSALGSALGEALFGDDEPDYEPDYDGSSEYVAPASTQACPLLCEVLSEANCEAEPGCTLSYECGLSPDCVYPSSSECITASCLPSTAEEDCEAPCEMLPRCTGQRTCDGLF